MKRVRWMVAALATVVLAFGGACNDDDNKNGSAGGGSTSGGSTESAAPVKAEGGYATGHVLGEDGKPITVAEDISISLYGVSEAGEKVSYSPGVKPDGTYKQKLVPGAYRFGKATLKAKHGPNTFRFDLVPQGSMWNKDRDAKEGIQQDFVWKVTGARPDVNLDPNNHTHWYGMSIGMRFITYREDTKKGAVAPPAGTKLIYTLKPTSKCIDGRELQPITLERSWNGDQYTPGGDLSDLPPADYEVSGVAKLPDGTTKPLLLQGRGDYPGFKQVMKAPLEADSIIGGMWKQLAGWVVD